MSFHDVESSRVASKNPNGLRGMGKRKFTAEQARQALLAAGVEMLKSVGPAGVASVSLAEAINRSGVPRPSAYRVFGGTDLDPQAAFQEQLVMRVVESDEGLRIDMIREACADILHRVNQTDELDTDQGLTDELVRVLKVCADAILELMLRDPVCGVYLSAMPLVRTGNQAERIEVAINNSVARLAGEFTNLFRELMSAFGVRLRPGWTEAHLFSVIKDATIGAVITAKATSDDEAAAYAAKTLALSYVALTALTTEPDSRRVVSAQPTAMLGLNATDLTG